MIHHLGRIILRFIRISDPWERIGREPRGITFGREAPAEWDRFLAAPSGIRVTCLDDVLSFLRGCVSTDAREPGAAKPWSLPEEFERLRAGDCTAHAGWAWHRLVSLGIQAELVAGRITPFDLDAPRHAWVVLTDGGREFLLEAVAKDEERLLRPLDSVRDRYRPEIGVDALGRRFGFAGALVTLQETLPPPRFTRWITRLRTWGAA